MSGIYGIIDTRRDGSAPELACQMAERMTHRDWYARDEWRSPDHNAALGRLGIGILNAEPQPACSADGNVIVFLSGEFFDWEGQPDGDETRRADLPGDAAYALRLYQQHGPAFVHHLAGAFAIAVYDRRRGQAILVSDRFGSYPVYFTCRDGRLIFAPEVKAVLLHPAVSRALDDTALAQVMRFQQVLGTRTFFHDVRLLPNASALTFDIATGAHRIEAYWSFARIRPQPASLTFDDAADEATRLMRQAVARRLRGDRRIGVFLSGGLDSRTILAACLNLGARPATLTFGLTNSQDSTYANRLAARAGTPHHYFEYKNGHWVKDFADFHLELTEGFHAWIHLHGINLLGEARQLFDLNLTGFAGDQVLGGFSVEPLLNSAPDETAYLTYAFQRFNQTYNWPAITEAEEHLLYTPQTHRRVAGLAFDSFRQELQPYLTIERERRIDPFGLMQSDMRHYFHYVTFGRSHLDLRFPYLDYDLLDFVFSVPSTFRESRRLQKAVLNRLAPSLAMVPVDKDGYLPTNRRLLHDAHALAQKVKRRVNRYLRSLFPQRFTLHTDYEGWLRDDLRGWAEGILFDQRLLERGIFNPDFVRSIWARHQLGQEPWTLGKVAAIMSYEMMLRRLHD